ncbi:MAG: hypothetical protein A3D31_19000 [Candidatus Fluviicola riflensis]|nr:MAG: hypothetical protein CHH17_05720 [Candidatus Fluviicola riflensis]OGS75876.1 MAG: hypothetical protein A3D31_19000 [Candidatus Fluviicola riflensis]OGS83556.1 MAG: hypothetical protein A2724_19015 [Fluviicola sp. RIFCSPHIGHO2_01_FULL_43_53]OGS85695.1 MAG: hypothetical protein A3E30_18545 [Fluviicola sp. RIFCSPHIGHO2_12_FULL_43_24]
MRPRIHFKSLALLLVICFSSHFSDAQWHCRKAKIIRNCTGTYVQFGKNNYLVCNEEKLSEWKNDQKIKVKTRKVASCPAPEGEICMLYYEYKGSVEITGIKPKGAPKFTFEKA